MVLTHAYIGASPYFPDYPSGPHRLLVAVRCHVGGLPSPFHALLDTGSRWCILPPDVARMLDCDLEPDPDVPPLHSRFGLHAGRLERIGLRFAAEEGEATEFEATWFISEDWPGPMVIGWKGGLERIRFAMDPGEDAFYFAPL